jgi:hypothetical protein
MKEIITIRQCFVCKEIHEFPNWRWKAKRIANKKVWYCSKGIDCLGCKELHLNDTGGSKIIRNGEICRKHFNAKPTTRERIRNMSTEQLLSGGLHGMPNQFGRDSEDYTPAIRQQEHKTLKEALK